MTAPLLDTHAWIWWIDGDRRLGRRAVARLDRLPPDNRPRLSAISLWEVATLVNLRRLDCPPSFDSWIARAADPASVQLLPITPEIASEVARLPGVYRHDPADRLIVATARIHQLPVLTTDRAMLESKLVRAWLA